MQASSIIQTAWQKYFSKPLNVSTYLCPHVLIFSGSTLSATFNEIKNKTLLKELEKASLLWLMLGSIILRGQSPLLGTQIAIIIINAYLRAAKKGGGRTGESEPERLLDFTLLCSLSSAFHSVRLSQTNFGPEIPLFFNLNTCVRRYQRAHWILFVITISL